MNHLLSDVNNNLAKLADVQKSVYDKFNPIPVQNNAVILQTITLSQGKWLLFGNTYIIVNDKSSTAYVVISGSPDYSFDTAQAYKGQVLLGDVKTSVSIMRSIELSEPMTLHLWCVTDGNATAYTPTLYALQLGSIYN